MYDDKPVAADMNVFVNKYFFIFSSMLVKIYCNFFDFNFDNGKAISFLLNEFCSININIIYIKTKPVDVAMPANDAPIRPAIWGRSGIKFMSISSPIFSDIKFENVNNFCCNIGVA